MAGVTAGRIKTKRRLILNTYVMKKDAGLEILVYIANLMI